MHPSANANEWPWFRRSRARRLNSSDATFLFEFLSARLEHLIVRRFFQSAGYELFAKRFFFIQSSARCSMTCIVRDNFPFFNQIGVLLRFLRRPGNNDPKQFAARLRPIGIGEFIRIALVDHRDFPGTFLHFFRRRRTHAIAMHRNFSRSRL